MKFPAFFPMLARVWSPSLAETDPIVPLVLAMAGSGLHSDLRHHRMSAGERVKERRTTEAEARRQKLGRLHTNVP